MQEMQVQSLGQEDPPEKEMASHSSIFAWEMPWTEEPGGLQCMGSQRVENNLATKPPPPILRKPLKNSSYYLKHSGNSLVFFFKFFLLK